MPRRPRPRRRRAHSASIGRGRAGRSPAAAQARPSRGLASRQSRRVRPADLRPRRRYVGPDPCSAQSSDDLPGAVAPHQRDDLAGRGVEVDLAHRGRVAVAHHDVARRSSPPSTAPAAVVAPSGAVGDVRRAVRAAGRRADGRRGPTAAADPSRPADRAGRPAARAARLAASSPGCPYWTRCASTTTQPIGVLHDPLEAVLGREHGDAEVVDEPAGPRPARPRPLPGRALTSARRARGSAAMRSSTAPRATRCCSPPDNVRSARRRSAGDAQQVEHLLDPAPHHVRLGTASCSMPVGELFLDRVGDEARQRVLADHADDVGELARRATPRVMPGRRRRGPRRGRR